MRQVTQQRWAPPGPTPWWCLEAQQLHHTGIRPRESLLGWGGGGPHRAPPRGGAWRHSSYTAWASGPGRAFWAGEALAEMVPGKGAWSMLRPGRGRCCVPGRGAAPEPGGQEGAHRMCGGGSPGGRGEGLSHQQAGAESFTFFMAGLRDRDIFVARAKLLALEFNTFYQLQARWKYLAGRQHGRETQVWTVRGNAEPAEPTGGRVQGHRSAHVLGRRFAAGLQLLCRLLQGLHLRSLQPRTKVLPVQSRWVREPLSGLTSQTTDPGCAELRFLNSGRVRHLLWDPGWVSGAGGHPDLRQREG